MTLTRKLWRDMTTPKDWQLWYALREIWGTWSDMLRDMRKEFSLLGMIFIFPLLCIGLTGVMVLFTVLAFAILGIIGGIIMIVGLPFIWISEGFEKVFIKPEYHEDNKQL